MTRDQQGLLLKTYRAGGFIDVMWHTCGQPARNLTNAGLLELVRERRVPGPYPSSHGRHVWTYRFTEAGHTRATEIMRSQRVADARAVGAAADASTAPTIGTVH